MDLLGGVGGVLTCPQLPDMLPRMFRGRIICPGAGGGGGWGSGPRWPLMAHNGSVRAGQVQAAGKVTSQAALKPFDFKFSFQSFFLFLSFFVLK